MYSTWPFLWVLGSSVARMRIYSNLKAAAGFPPLVNAFVLQRSLSISGSESSIPRVLTHRIKLTRSDHQSRSRGWRGIYISPRHLGNSRVNWRVLKFCYRTKKKFNMDMEYNSLYKERESRKGRGSAGRKKEKAEKELTCVYAYNDGGNVKKKGCVGHAGCGGAEWLTRSWTRDRNSLALIHYKSFE